MRLFILCVAILICGCNDYSGSANATINRLDNATFDKADGLKGRKVLNVRITAEQIDLVMEDGGLVSFYGYMVRTSGDTSPCRIGAK